MRQARRWPFIGLVPIALIGANAGCAGDAEAVTPNVVVISRGQSALSAVTPTAINGTYSGCAERSGAWSVRISGTDPLANDPLSVIKNDANCQLAITEIVADTTYVGSPVIALSTSYAASASSFSPSGVGAAVLEANAKIDSVAFASDFAITVAYSAAPTVAQAVDAAATYATVEASASTLLIPAPDYTMSLTTPGAALTIQVDVAKVVQSVSGFASLTDQSQTGEEYVVDLGTLGANPSYAAVATAYAAATKHSISGANPQIPASQLGLVGESLASSVARTIVVSHTLVAVKSYQLFRITFEAP